MQALLRCFLDFKRLVEGPFPFWASHLMKFRVSIHRGQR